jgi:8-hydroxy-5-deazaflavin:NADPH oxidoreductase
VLHSAGTAHLDGKVLMDIANDLDFSKGSPVTRTSDTPGSSVGEQIQAAFPKVKVVKTLNTLSAFVMVDPKSVAGGDSTVFVNGNDAEAKKVVMGLLEGLGWTDIMDLGDIGASRAVELLLPVWLKAWAVIGNTPFNFKIVR